MTMRLGEEQQKDIKFFDSRPTVTRCVFCPRWRFTGTAAECRQAAADHRASKHPDLPPYKRSRKKGNWSSMKLPPREPVST